MTDSTYWSLILSTPEVGLTTEKTAIDGNNGWYGNQSDHLPVNKVGGAVHRVDDPRRFVGKNTRLAFSDRLLADETVEKRKRWKQLSK